MSESTDFKQAYAQAEKLRAAGRLREAEVEYQQLLTTATGQQHEDILRALVELYLQDRQVGKAIEILIALTEATPDRLYYYARLGALLDGIGETGVAIYHYQRLLQRQPQLPAAHYNLALLYKRGKQYTEAVSSYKRAIELGIDNVQEVYSNLGVLYAELRQRDKAISMYDRALAVDQKYIPALFNKAGILEESGQRLPAREIYEHILALNPRHWDALARLAHLSKITSADDPLLNLLRRATEAASDPLAREGLYFALGKVLDDLGQYDQAFAAYGSANAIGRMRNPPYDKQQVERYFTDQIEQISKTLIQNKQTALQDSPIFVCGMFRSGSTLVEQILGCHRDVVAGGELDLIHWLVSMKLMPWPQKLQESSRLELTSLAMEYLARVRKLFPNAKHITDKRPDNFLFLGLIRMLFPAVRIVYTRRNPLDNCLSIYFQQLGGNLNYTTDLENIAHYYKQQERLLRHWTECFSGNIFTVDYDELVQAPEPLLRRLLDFLGLPWDDKCLRFSRTANLVQTASVWQVREDLHTRSSGRWQNYAAYVRGIQPMFA